MPATNPVTILVPAIDIVDLLTHSASAGTASPPP
jgi:hypothetical protein